MLGNFWNLGLKTHFFFGLPLGNYLTKKIALTHTLFRAVFLTSNAWCELFPQPNP
jgi:hypothetical protein